MSAAITLTRHREQIFQLSQQYSWMDVLRNLSEDFADIRVKCRQNQFRGRPMATGPHVKKCAPGHDDNDLERSSVPQNDTSDDRQASTRNDTYLNPSPQMTACAVRQMHQCSAIHEDQVVQEEVPAELSSRLVQAAIDGDEARVRQLVDGNCALCRDC